MNNILFFDAIGQGSTDQVGGKGMNLALLTRAGFPVPPGFCVTAAAYRAAGSGGEPAVTGDLRQALIDAYDKLGRGLVAVRSSATSEDGAELSFAGQQETILGVEGDDALVDAVQRCWHSLYTERAVAYRRQHGIDDEAVAMAVVVQRLIRSEVSGVLFTHDPLDRLGKTMLIEAARGLGEAVVSGAVMPDRFHTDRETGELVDQHIHHQRVVHTVEGVKELDAALGDAACMDAGQLETLTKLGRKVESHFGEPRDVEWAWADGQCWLLQARPITAAAAFELEQVRREEMGLLAERAEARGTVWARYNLAEVLPDPTPMTWSIVKRFMSGRGGFGLMYRDMGFDPDPALDEEGFIDLVCGRPYVNLSREPMLYFRDFPYGYDFGRLKADPQLAIYPTPATDNTRVTGRFYLRLPVILWHMIRSGGKVKRRMREQADRLKQHIFPRFEHEVRNEHGKVDLATLTPRQILERLEHWIHRTLVDFARDSLQPSLLAAVALAELEKGLAAHMDEERAKVEARALMTGVHPDADSDLAEALRSLTSGAMTRESFLHQFGHRGPHEMELSQPRWREQPETLPAVESGAASSAATSHSDADGVDERWSKLMSECNVPAGVQRALTVTLETARTYLGLRESAKHYLIMGFAVIRELLVDLDARLHMEGGIFHLTLEELPRAIEEAEHADWPAHAVVWRKLISDRKRRRRLALSLPVPQVFFSDDLDAIGRPPAIDGATEFKGTPLSFGLYEGEALVLDEPSPLSEHPQPYVLVCPTTDPAWVPLFLHAKGLVMETGGVLSHGAIVAREFGIPAVAGIAEVHHRIRTGQRVRVDGTSGVVHLIDSDDEGFEQEARKAGGQE